MALFVQKNKSELSDLDLIKDYKQRGNQETISCLYSRYITLVYGLCIKYLKDETSSKDAVMEIFAILTNKLKTHDIDNFKSWLYTVSKNHCLGILRKRKTTLTKQNQADLMYSSEVFHLDTIDKEDQISQLHKCMERLPEKQHKCVQMFYFEKKTYQEIVEVLELEWKHVRSFIQNGRRNLKNCMEANRGE